MLANRLDRARYRQFVLARVDRTPRRSVRERQRKYLSATRRNKRATHETYLVLKAMRQDKRATYEMNVFLKAMTPNVRATHVTFVVL